MAHKTASGRSSTAWKALERAVAEIFRKVGFNASRITRADDFGAELPDVEIAELPRLAVDTKYKNGGFAHHTLYEKEVFKYADSPNYDIAIMPTRSGKSSKIYVTLLLVDLAKIMAKAFLNQGQGGWCCPRCREPIVEPNFARGVVNLHEYSCSACQLTFICAEEPPPPIEPEPEPVPKGVPKNQRKALDEFRKRNAS